MKTTLAALLLTTLTLCSCSDQPKAKVILVVFAHPDDEDAIGPLLVKYAKTDKVYLIIATDGRLGTRPGYPTGDSLVLLRQTESQCACKTMGLEPPIFLGYADGFDTRNGVGVYMRQSIGMKDELTEKIKEIDPDLIITFGPDGDTGHSDHRMISNMITEIVLKEGWVDKIPLYYLGWTERDNEKFKIIGGLNTVAPGYLNVSINYSQQEEDIAMKALQCDKSQLSEQEIKDWIEVERNDSSNVFHFRQLTIPSNKKDDF